MGELNEKVEGPQGQPWDRLPLREVSPEELIKILEEHQEWLKTQRKGGKRANLAHANLQKAILNGADLQEATLLGANLQKADLAASDLQKAILRKADLQGATLGGANLQGADLELADLQEASLRNTTLREADLQDADLTNAKGLLAGQLAGANVSGAKLPQDIHKFEALTTIDEASKNTKRIFLAMLLGCAYSVLTIFSTTDARLLTNSSSSPLPIIQTPIPIAGFFGVAPAILLAIFLYFHFYLQRLWEGLAQLPAIFPDGRPLDQRAYPWLLNALVRSHFALLRERSPPISRLQTGVSILLAWWAVPFTITVFWLRSLQRHDWILTGFLVAFLVLAIVCAAWFQRLAKKTLRGQQWEPIRFKKNWRRVQPYKVAIKRNYKFAIIGMIVLVFAFGVSYGAINGTPGEVIPELLPYVGARAFADLTEQDVSTKPSNWFVGDKKLTEIVSGAQLKGMDLRHASATRAFLVNADLRGANLQGADLPFAKLQNANLLSAKLKGAHLFSANLQQANLGAANLAGADLSLAELQEAILLLSNLQGALLFRANLQGASLGEARGLTASQVKKAKNWELAFYSDAFLKELGRPPDHNEKVKEKLAELEKEKKATGAQ